MNEFAAIAPNHRLGNVVLLDLLKFKIDFAAGLYGPNERSVCIDERPMRIGGIGAKRVPYCACAPHDPSGQYAAILLPVGGIEYSVHVIVRVARENVDALVRVILPTEQVGIHVTPAFGAVGRFVHAMTRGNTFGQRLVHSSHDGRYSWISQVFCESFLEPAYLRFIKLIGGCAIEVVKGHPTIDPMEIGLQFAVTRVVPQSLGAQNWRIQPIRKLQEKILAGLQRRDRLMISNAQEKWNRTEGHNLAINEIRPLDRFVFGDRQRLLDVIGLMLDVFIEAAEQTPAAPIA